jgi:phenylpyruvate tautomerase PptA (4-oxalocrotonate tautomerase family)
VDYTNNPCDAIGIDQGPEQQSIKEENAKAPLARKVGETMPWINLTIRRGTFTKDVQHTVMAKLTDALMFWEKIPDNPEARKKMMGWVYEVAEDSGYSAGSPHHKEPFYCIEVRIIAGRLDRLTKQHIMQDFTKIIMLAEGKTHFSEDATRVWVTIVELQTEDWSIGGHTDWLRDYESALNVLGNDSKLG